MFDAGGDESVDDGQEKGGHLSAAGLGAGHQVPAREDDREVAVAV